MYTVSISLLSDTVLLLHRSLTHQHRLIAAKRLLQAVVSSQHMVRPHTREKEKDTTSRARTQRKLPEPGGAKDARRRAVCASW